MVCGKNCQPPGRQRALRTSEKAQVFGGGHGGAQRPRAPHRSGTLDSCVASSPDTCLEPSQPRWSLALSQEPLLHLVLFSSEQLYILLSSVFSLV